ncbi:hypothetical protein C8R43DRAFT_942556 [Mycena crocata]|nr:hypothetical protein C8R43DRAFT_942556 [Mycena crocata]
MSPVTQAPRHLSKGALDKPKTTRPTGVPFAIFNEIHGQYVIAMALTGVDPDFLGPVLETLAISLLKLEPCKKVISAVGCELCMWPHNAAYKYTQCLPGRVKTLPACIFSLQVFATELRALRKSAHAQFKADEQIKEAHEKTDKEELLAVARKSKKKKVVSAETIPESSDDEPIFLDEDEDMEDAPPLIRPILPDLDDDTVKDANSIDVDAVSVVIEAASASSASTQSSGNSAKFKDKLSFKKNKTQACAETVRIPYVCNSRIDCEPASYSKAMDILDKTQPDEAEKVAIELPPPPMRKRRRYIFFTKSAPAKSNSLSPATELTAKQTAKLIPKATTKIMNDAHRAMDQQAKIHAPDEAILCQERNVRGNMAHTTHQIVYHVKVRQELAVEHTRLLKEIADRCLANSAGSSKD